MRFRMQSLKFLAASTVSLLGAASLTGGGCGGNEFVLSTDSGPDLGARDTGAGSDALGEGGPTGAYCDALRAYYSRCQYTARCDQQNLENCGTFASALSDVARAAFIACQQVIACNHGAAWVHESCVRTKLEAAAPSAEQMKLANDYCAACMQAGSTCTQATFYSEGFIQAADGPGFDALLYNDAFVHSVDQMCVSALSCSVAFRVCADTYITSQAPTDACRD
jgi:hypothetical protein